MTRAMSEAVTSAFHVGAGRVQEFDGLAAALGLALGDAGVEGGHDGRAQQVPQERPIAGGIGLDDHLVGAAGAGQETGHVEGRVPGLDGGEPGERHAIGFLGRHAGHVRRTDRGWGGFGGRLVLGLAAHTPAQHRVELVQHNGGQARKDDQLEDLQRRPLDSTGSQSPI